MLSNALDSEAVMIKPDFPRKRWSGTECSSENINYKTTEALTLMAQ